jgi:monofunctional biosynthetic peptidoglycan transglycosylase
MVPYTQIPDSNLDQRKWFKRNFFLFVNWLNEHKFITIILLITLVAIIEYISLPSKREIVQLGKINPKLTALMEQRKDEADENGKTYQLHWHWVPLSQMNENIKHAVIAAEDGMFYEHEGIDWYEVKESIKKDIQKGKFVRGASTITQQVAKNLFLSTSKDPIRKLKEIIIASRLEDELSKNRILEIYLNIVEWGDGVFGVEGASTLYFGKHATELNREEAAKMAAVLPSPLRHKPTDKSRYVNYRKKIILARLETRGW